MQKFTKIIATIGPSSDSRETIKQLYKSGMDVARLNFSHGSHGYFKEVIRKIRQVSPNIAIMLDTKGPEVRTGICKDGSIALKAGQELFLDNSSDYCDDKVINVDYPYLKNLKKGMKIFFGDGLIESKLISTSRGRLKIKIVNSGNLGSKKTVQFRGHSLRLSFISKQDKRDILFAIENHLSFIAASFVKSPDDVTEIRKIIQDNGSGIKIIAKIEHLEAVKNIKEIVKVSDGIMVARGDLGVEVPLEKVPAIQSLIIDICNKAGIPVIVATQMLESMRFNPRPTRAEVSDVSQAILSGADAVMLSGETASGKYPVESVSYMKKIAIEYDPKVEKSFGDMAIISEFHKKDSFSVFVANAAYLASKTLNIRAIITPTESGFTARNVSRFKPKCPIYAITKSESVQRQLQLSWGVFPILDRRNHSGSDEKLSDIVSGFVKKGLMRKEDLVVLTSGSSSGRTGETNTLRVLNVGEILSRKFLK